MPTNPASFQLSANTARSALDKLRDARDAIQAALNFHTEKAFPARLPIPPG